MCFKAHSFHDQHTVTKQALDALLVQLLEEMAAVSSHWVHAQPPRRPTTKNVNETEIQWYNWELMGPESTDWQAARGHDSLLVTLQTNQQKPTKTLSQALDQCWSKETLQWWKCSVSALFSTVATGHMQPLSTWNVAGVTEELNL